MAASSWRMRLRGACRQVLDGALVLLGLEIIDGHLLEGIDSCLNDCLGEEQHPLRVVNACKGATVQAWREPHERGANVSLCGETAWLGVVCAVGESERVEAAVNRLWQVGEDVARPARYQRALDRRARCSGNLSDDRIG